MLSFGDPRPFIPPIRQARAALILQVTDVEEARQAVDLGADVIVAQGAEAGGHGARRGRSTLPFVPVVVDLAAPTPVLAAGGIADGRGVAAALALGAAGALIGTRFQATAEGLADPAIKKAIVEGRGEDTERSRVLDIVQGLPIAQATWDGRSLGHPFLDQWRGRDNSSPRTPRPGRPIRRGWPGATCLPAGLGRRGHRSHHPAVGRRPGRRAGRAGAGRAGPGRNPLNGGPGPGHRQRSGMGCRAPE